MYVCMYVYIYIFIYLYLHPILQPKKQKIWVQPMHELSSGSQSWFKP